jgi:hypothetical protein
MADQDRPPIFEPYSIRQRRAERQGQPVVFVYDPIPDAFIHQVISVFADVIGSRIGGGVVSGMITYSPESVWREINRVIAVEAGIATLAQGDMPNRQKLTAYLTSATTSTDAKLDAIELAVRALAESALRWRNVGEGPRGRLPFQAAIDQINTRFFQHDLGYQFIEGRLTRVDAQLLHAEVVLPALAHLHEAGFEGALDEFMRAHQHYRHGEHQDTVVDANNAFESTMKVICERQEIALTGRENASQLVRKLAENEVIPQYLEPSLQGLSTLRNNAGGHGQGMAIVEVPAHLAGYSLYLAATHIQFLMNSWQAARR